MCILKLWSPREETVKKHGVWSGQLLLPAFCIRLYKNIILYSIYNIKCPYVRVRIIIMYANKNTYWASDTEKNRI